MIALDYDHYLKIDAIISAKLAGAVQLLAFGSRVNGASRSFSDLDLVVVADSKLEQAIYYTLKDNLEFSDLPFRVDLMDWHRLSQDFQQIVREQAIDLKTVMALQWQPRIGHHGGTQGVTGSCHELFFGPSQSILIDCGLFQGKDHSTHGENSANAEHLAIDFDLSSVQALVVTHAHIDHIGRIPYLLMAGFNQPIYCSIATAKLMPLMLRDAVKLGITRNERMIEALIDRIESLMVPLSYGQWLVFSDKLKFKLKPAGHVLGSAYIECQVKKADHLVERPHFVQLSSSVVQSHPSSKYHQGKSSLWHKVIFSGDLGAPFSPLLSNPKSSYSCDTLVLESTYGNRLHSGRTARQQQLKSVIERAVANRGVVLIPAFSLGRTQALLYEFEQLVYQYGRQDKRWQEIEVVVDSPMANDFTQIYRELKPLWDKEAKSKLKYGRHPLAFEQLTTIDDNQTHQQVVHYLKKTARPTVVIAASGMCMGGRIVNYLKALIEDSRTDIVFVGYQGLGTHGRTIQQYGDKSRYSKGWVELDGKKYDINASVHTLSGYSAHADQKDLVNFVKRMRYKPKYIRLVHGDLFAKQALKQILQTVLPSSKIDIP